MAAATFNQCVAHVFGYGSLVSKPSREATLGHTQLSVVLGKVNGLKRVFSATSAANTSLNYKYFCAPEDQDGLEVLPNFLPTFLNVEIRPGATCQGAFIPVTAEGLRAFDQREANYVRVDITHLVDESVNLIIGKDCPVFVYVAKPEAVARSTHWNARIPSVYIDTCREAFEEADLADDFENNTDIDLDVILVKLPYYLERY